MKRLQQYGATAIRPLRDFRTTVRLSLVDRESHSSCAAVASQSRRSCNQCIRIKSHSVILNSILKYFTELSSNVHAVNPKNSFSVKSYGKVGVKCRQLHRDNFHPHPHTVPGHTVPVPIPA